MAEDDDGPVTGGPKVREAGTHEGRAHAAALKRG
jgi:hypothetical protein